MLERLKYLSAYLDTIPVSHTLEAIQEAILENNSPVKLTHKCTVMPKVSSTRYELTYHGIGVCFTVRRSEDGPYTVTGARLLSGSDVYTFTITGSLIRLIDYPYQDGNAVEWALKHLSLRLQYFISNGVYNAE